MNHPAILRTVILTSLLLIAHVMVSHPDIMAQSALSQKGEQNPNKSALAISPAIVEHVLTPGEKKEFTLRLTNMTNFPLPISGSIKNFEPLEDVQDKKLLSLYDASKWFTIKEPDFILQANQTRTITVTIVPPPAAGPGGHYASVYFQPLLPEGVLTPSTAYLSAKVGALVFLIVPGALEEKIAISEVEAPLLQQSGSLDISTTITNGGNVHISPNGNLVIKNWRGKVIDKLPLRFGVILPGTNKTATTTWEKSWAFGKYTATAQVSYGSGNTEPDEVTVSYWVIPWALILIMVIVVLPGIFFFIRTKGRWKAAWRALKQK